MPTLPAVSYSRRSSDPGDGNYSLDYQHESNLRCAERESLHVIESVAEDVTGTIHLEKRTPSRAEIRRGDVGRHGSDVWKMIVSGQVKALIVYRIDRLSRAPTMQALTLIDGILRHGCKIYISSSGQQITDPDDIAVIIGAWQSSQDKKKTVDQLRDGRMRKAKEKWLGAGPAPYGYAKQGEGKSAKLAVDEKEAEIVKGIFSRYATRTETMRGIAESLNGRGIPAPEGGLWHYSTVRWLLRNPIYIGRVIYAGVEVMDETLIIVPPHQWSAAQARMKTNQNNARRNTKGQYLMRMHLYCVCGARMTPVTNTGNQPRYLCCHRSYPKQIRCYESADTAQIDRMAADYIRWAVSDEVLTRGVLEKERAAVTAQQNAPDQIAAIDAELANQHRRIDRLMRAFGDGDDAALNVIDTTRESIRTLEVERESLMNAERESESRRLERESIAQHVKRLRHVLDHSTFEAMRDLVEILDVRANLTRDQVGRGVVFSCDIAPDLFSRL